MEKLAKYHPDPSYCMLDLKLSFWAISIALPLFTLLIAVANFDVGISHVVKLFLVALLSNRKAFWCEDLEVRIGICSWNCVWVILTHITNNADFN